MKIKLLTLNTLPCNENNYWQIVFLPTISLYKSFGSHYAINAEWLFWSVTLLIYKDDETTVYKLEDI
jgi:hypothetical protein